MNWEIFGYIGTVLILVSFLIEDVAKLRMVNMVGAIFWIVYGFGIMAKPTIIVNFFVIAIHSFWFLKRIRK
jgi:hypothetical protein